METAHIYIYGDIGCWQSKDAADWGEITLKGVKDQYEAQKDAKEITLHIHSPGGYVTEGFAIHDYIRSLGKPVTTIIEGMCYSIATVIALAGDKRVMTSNSDFMIHNPWGAAWGESTEIQKYADELKKLEQKVADFYAAKTKITSEEALELMKLETFMSPEDSLEKGFITEIATVMKAVAKFNLNSNKMSKEKLTKEQSKSKLAKLLDKLDNFLTGDAPQNKMVLDATGEVEIDFPDLAEDDVPGVGDKATIDGSPAEGEHVMPSGETYVFTAGELTEIKPKEEEADTSEEMEALQDEVAQLKKAAKKDAETIKALKKSAAEKDETITEHAKMLKSIQKDMKQLKKSITSDFEAEEEEGNDGKNGKGGNGKPKTRQLFKPKK